MTASDSSSPLFEIRDLTVRQGDKALLSGLSDRVDPGELVAIIGPSGSGKTTLLRTLAGLIGDGSGVYLRGEAPCDLCWPDYRRQVLLVAQQPVLLRGTVAENLAWPSRYHRVDKAFSVERARELLDRLNLEDVKLEKSARELSVGQQQRVCLVRSVLLQPPVMLLDEPTSALDEDATQAVNDLITELATKHDLAALMVTHDRATAESLCNRVIDLEDYLVEAAS